LLLERNKIEWNGKMMIKEGGMAGIWKINNNINNKMVY